MFGVPNLLDDTARCLGELLVELDSLWMRYEVVADSSDSSKLHAIRDESITLKTHFIEWEDSQALGFRPTSVGKVSKRQNTSPFSAGYWPGKIDTYFDLYVAGVWNMFRAARLLLITLIHIASKKVPKGYVQEEHVLEAHRTFEDMAASIPYHLTDNLPQFIKDSHTTKEIADPGKLLGGLLLMHPLYVASRVPVLSETERAYSRDCLIWISANMGLGQAALLAKVCNLNS